jgi:DNA-binding ferritin-like protein
MEVTVITKNSQPMADFVSTLLESRNQAHVFHWQVQGEGSDARHRALETYYDEIVDLIDELVESYQGRYGILRGYKGNAEYLENQSELKYFEALCMYVEKNRSSLPQDSYIQNQIDEIIKLIEITKNKLINLR